MLTYHCIPTLSCTSTKQFSVTATQANGCVAVTAMQYRMNQLYPLYTCTCTNVHIHNIICIHVKCHVHCTYVHVYTVYECTARHPSILTLAHLSAFLFFVCMYNCLFLDYRRSVLIIWRHQYRECAAGTRHFPSSLNRFTSPTKSGVSKLSELSLNTDSQTHVCTYIR